MPVPVQGPDGQYDFSHTWQNSNDEVEASRTFRLDPVEQQKIGVALATANPAMPEAQIVANLTVPGVPPRFGLQGTPTTVDEMFARNLGHINDFAPTNFSGTQGEFSGTSTPAIPAW